MKTIYDYIGIAYFAEFILAVILMINGLNFFILDNSNVGVLIAVGMLTFVSIFFSFLYSSTELKLLFDKFIDKSTNKMKAHAIKKLKSGDLAGTRMTTVDIEMIQNLKNWVNPTLWLHSSIFLYLFSIVFGLVSVGISGNLYTTTKKLYTRNIILFRIDKYFFLIHFNNMFNFYFKTE